MASGSMVAALYAKLSMDTKGFDKGVKDASKGMKKLGDSTEKTNEKLEASRKKMAKVGLAAAGAGTAVLGFMASAAQATSDLNEAINVSGLVFEESAGSMLEWSKAAADTMGQSQRGALEASAAVGGLLKNMGMADDETVKWSKKLVELAADMGSAFNSDPADAVFALGAGLRGETLPLRRFNVFLSDAAVKARAVEMGLADTTAEVDNYGKVQGRLSIIMENTSRIQGDFVNTSDGLANSQRILAAKFEETRAAIGQQMLPILEGLVSMAINALDAFGEWNEQTDGLVGKLAILGGAAAVALGAILLLSAGFNAAMAQMALINPVFAAFVAVAALAAIAVGTIIKAKADWKDEVELARVEMAKFNPEIGRATEYLKEMAAALPDASDPLAKLPELMGSWAGETILVGKAVKAGLAPALKALQSAGVDVEKVVHNDIAALGKLADRLGEGAITGEMFNNLISDMTDEGKEAALVLWDLEKTTGFTAQEMSYFVDTLGETKGLLDAVSQGAEDEAAAFLDSSDAQRQVAETLGLTREAAVDYWVELDRIRESELGAAGAAAQLARDVRIAGVEAENALAEFGYVPDVMEPATASADELAEALQGVIDRIRELADLALSEIELDAKVRSATEDVAGQQVELGFALQGKDNDGELIEDTAEAVANLNQEIEETDAALRKLGTATVKQSQTALEIAQAVSEQELTALGIAKERQSLIDTNNALIEAGVDATDARIISNQAAIDNLAPLLASAMAAIDEAANKDVFFDYRFRLIGGIPELPPGLSGGGGIVEPQGGAPSATTRSDALTTDFAALVANATSGNDFSNPIKDGG